MVDIALQWTSGIDEQIHSFVNGIATTGGGMHVEGFKKGLTSSVNDAALSAIHATSTPVPPLLGEDVREGLTAIIWADLPTPLYEGWAKVELGNLEVRPAVGRSTQQFLTKWFKENPVPALRIVEKSANSAHARATARRVWNQKRRRGRP